MPGMMGSAHEVDVHTSVVAGPQLPQMGMGLPQRQLHPPAMAAAFPLPQAVLGDGPPRWSLPLAGLQGDGGGVGQGARMRMGMGGEGMMMGMLGGDMHGGIMGLPAPYFLRGGLLGPVMNARDGDGGYYIILYQ